MHIHIMTGITSRDKAESSKRHDMKTRSAKSLCSLLRNRQRPHNRRLDDLAPHPRPEHPCLLYRPITPANLLTTWPPSRTTHTSLSPARHLSIPGPGTWTPVNTTTASSLPPPRKCNSVPSGSVHRSTPSVVLFSPISPAERALRSPHQRKVCKRWDSVMGTECNGR